MKLIIFAELLMNFDIEFYYRIIEKLTYHWRILSLENGIIMHIQTTLVLFLSANQSHIDSIFSTSSCSPIFPLMFDCVFIWKRRRHLSPSYPFRLGIHETRFHRLISFRSSPIKLRWETWDPIWDEWLMPLIIAASIIDLEVCISVY